MNKWQEQNLYDTPDDWHDMMQRIKRLSGSEKTVALVYAMMTWNLSVKLHNIEVECKDDETMQLLNNGQID